jgi:hypothetical protein
MRKFFSNRLLGGPFSTSNNSHNSIDFFSKNNHSSDQKCLAIEWLWMLKITFYQLSAMNATLKETSFSSINCNTV